MFNVNTNKLYIPTLAAIALRLRSDLMRKTLRTILSQHTPTIRIADEAKLSSI